MDISDTLAPTSDQLDAVDLLSGPRTFTIERVTKGNDEQPVNIHLADFPRPWRPGKSMRRVLVACWGADASAYVGRSVRLYCDPDVRFGGQAVGGTRIAALSHIDKPKQVPLLVSRGKSAIFVVKPLADEPTRPAQQPAKATTEPAEVPVTEEQMQAIHAGFMRLGIGDREGALAQIAELIYRDVTSPNNLTHAEAVCVLDWIKFEEQQEKLPEPPLDGE